MLIISKFHDYYDVGMKMGVDKTVIYDRKTISVEGNFPPTSKYKHNGWDGSVLAFCGKFYPFVFHVTDFNIDRIVWNVEEALKTLNVSGKRYWDEYSLESESGVKKFFDRKYPELENLFHKYRTPVFGFQAAGRPCSWMKPKLYGSLVVNPKLKDLQFYKIKDPITAFQDIYMFMSGVIGAPPKPKEKMSDKVLAAAKGHDGPYSFKKPPGKRGKNRWR